MICLAIIGALAGFYLSIAVIKEVLASLQQANIGSASGVPFCQSGKA